MFCVNFCGFAEAKPKAVGDPFDEGTFGDGASAVIFAFREENGFDFVRSKGAGPVYFEGKLVVALGKEASIPCGKFEDGWSAQSPMGDEDGTFDGFFEGRDCGVGNGDALEIS